jgi:Asp-tRNA(Asn)/Glu-tRNA(Gln) amidotransferase B subunit
MVTTCINQSVSRSALLDNVSGKARYPRRQAGRGLVGDIMKTHKGQVEAGDVKRIAEELLKG